MDKKSLRSRFGKIREAVIDKPDKDAEIAEKLIKSAVPDNTDTVLIYASIGTEINTADIIDNFLERNIRVALPKCGENGIMNFHLISSRDELKSGKYNIPEPPADAVQPEITENTICIVPGLAFTEKGERLGYGGGFYDRFTAMYPKLYTIGLAYEELMTDSLPALPHDLSVNVVVTNERTVLCIAE